MPNRFALKDHINENRIINDRLIFTTLLAGLLFIVVMVRLAVLQVVEHEHFETLSNRNRVDTIPLAPKRGLIYDRNGIVLAENIPTFSLDVTPENLVDAENSLQELASLMAVTDKALLEFKSHIKRQQGFRQFSLRHRLTEQEVALFSVNRHRFPGVEVVGRLIRSYPQGALFSHAVGYVGRINADDQKRIDVKDYQGTLHIGKTGIEKQYEDLLHGTVGYQQIETNVQGRVIRELNNIPSISGQDLFLNIDMNLQRVAAEALSEFNGSVVALEPKTGSVLAMVSKPDFDPNAFVSGISNKDYAILRDSIDRPLFNRALRGRYPPGSVLKPFVALAGLEAGIVTEKSEGFCPGWFTLPGQEHRYRCWKHKGHGTIYLKKAIAQSCDVYFYDLASALGIERLHSFLDLFNFGRKTGIDIPNESKGLSPSPAWKRAKKNQVWFPGETVISGIGQGFNQTTPIQLAHATAILAMRGINMTPQVAKASRDGSQSVLELFTNEDSDLISMTNNQHWEAVIDSMIEVVHGKRGTARHIAKGLPFEIAGKTGTAQVFGIKQDEKYDIETLATKLHDHALFIAFAPVDEPKIVVVVIAENGGSGSGTAAPIARKVLDQYFGL